MGGSSGAGNDPGIVPATADHAPAGALERRRPTVEGGRTTDGVAGGSIGRIEDRGRRDLCSEDRLERPEGDRHRPQHRQRDVACRDRPAKGGREPRDDVLEGKVFRPDDLDRAARIPRAVDIRGELLDYGGDVGDGDEVDRIATASEDPGPSRGEDRAADDRGPGLHVGGRSDDQWRHRGGVEIGLDRRLRPPERQRVLHRRVVDGQEDEAPDARGRGGLDEVAVPVAIDRGDPAGLASAEPLDGRDHGVDAVHRRRQGREIADVSCDELELVGQRTEGGPTEHHVPGQDPDGQAAGDEAAHDIAAELASPTGHEDHRAAPAGIAAIAGASPTLPRIDAPTSTAASSSGSR
jgi:hypothetical protein